ncbi:MAG: SseB family protein [Clostridia bacterium]|nr:SseB family protein [Clostridia bacterium]
MNVYDIINMPENMEGMRKIMARLGEATASDNEIREALLVLADSVNEFVPDEHEMKVRFQRYEDNPKSRLAQHVLISGLSYITLWYAGRHKGSGLDILIYRTGEKRKDALVIFSSEEEAMSSTKDDDSCLETELDEVLDMCGDNDIRYVLINPKTDRITLSVDSMRSALDAFMATDENICSVMEEGILGEDLFPEIMEVFVLEHVKVLMKDNKEHTGVVLPWSRHKPVMEQMLTLRTQGGDEISVCIPDIKHICLYIDDLPY